MSTIQFIHGFSSAKHIERLHTDILTLHNDIFPATPVKNMTQLHGKYEDPYWLLVLWGSRLIGICAIGIQGTNQGYVYNVGLAKYQRRKRIGAAIIHQIKKHFKGFELDGHVHEENFDAMLFFHKMGAKRIDELTPSRSHHNYYKFKVPEGE